MKIWQAVTLGTLQGVTEFLPISSSGHLVLAQNWLQIYPPPFYFDVFVHLVSLIAIAYYFRSQIQKIILDRNWELIKYLCIGTLPIVIVGLAAADQIKGLFSSNFTAGFGLLITAVFNFTTAENFSNQTKTKALNPLKALLTGVMQALAVIPGISRSGSTLLGGSVTKISKQKALEFSFLLAIPAILAANVFYTFTSSQSILAEITSYSFPVYLTGGLVCFITSLASLKLLQKVLNTSKYHFFGWYCLIMGLVSIGHYIFS